MTIRNPVLRLAGALALTTLTPAGVLAEGPPSPPIAGGWSELRPNNPELVAVARFVVPKLPVRGAKLARIEGGERQVVAGTNYRIALQLTNGTRWRALVWRKLDGSYELTRSAQNK